VLNSGTIDENGTFTLTGSFTDPGTQDSHTVVISWGPGEGSTTLNLAAGVTTFSAGHQYLDDNPTGTASDTYPVSVTVTDDDTYPIGVTVTDDDTGSASAAASVVVNNVAPVLAGVGNSAATIGAVAEGQAVTVSATFTDVGTADTHTAVVEWGDGMTTTATV